MPVLGEYVQGAVMDYSVATCMVVAFSCCVAVFLLPVVWAWKRKNPCLWGIALLAGLGLICWPLWFCALLCAVADEI